MGCGGVCTRFNDGVCMGACSMDAVGRENYVKVLEEREVSEAKMSELSQNEPSGKGVVLKPLNPSAYDMFEPKKTKMVEQPECAQPKFEQTEAEIAYFKAENTKALQRMKF